MEILVLHPGALGDIILSLPALRILRDHFGGARITLAANTDFSEIAVPDYADRLLSLASLPVHHLFGPESVTVEEGRFWRSYDRILSWTGHGSEEFSTRLAQQHPCTITAGWKPAPDEPRHVSRLFVDSLHPWVVPPAAVPPAAIRPSATDQERGLPWLQKQGWDIRQRLIAVHPGAGSPAKRWPLEKFEALARGLMRNGKLLLIEGPAEPGLGCRLAANLPCTAIQAIRLPLQLLAGVLCHCHAFIGNDSGIAHLAAALQVPCVILFGPTLPANWAPLWAHVSILRDARGCAACKQLPGASHTCLQQLAVELVRSEVDRMLASGSAKE